MSDEIKIIDFDHSEGSSVADQIVRTLGIYTDIVYCIDLTASMSPVIQKVKEFVRTFHEDYERSMVSYQRSIKQLRIKVIGFRDIYCDGAYAFDVSDFFCLPDQSAEFLSFVDKLEAKGGGGGSENSLEALAMAMQSDWCKTFDNSARKRHIIVLFTDAPAHPFKKAIAYTGTNYPSNMPKSYIELVDWWSGQASFAPGVDFNMDQFAKRLVIFAPESEPWITISEDFDSCITEFIKPENGGGDITSDFLFRFRNVY